VALDASDGTELLVDGDVLLEKVTEQLE